MDLDMIFSSFCKISACPYIGQVSYFLKPKKIFAKINAKESDQISWRGEVESTGGNKKYNYRTSRKDLSLGKIIRQWQKI